MRRAYGAGLSRRICRFGRRRNNVKKRDDRWILLNLDVSSRLGRKVG